MRSTGKIGWLKVQIFAEQKLIFVKHVRLLKSFNTRLGQKSFIANEAARRFLTFIISLI